MAKAITLFIALCVALSLNAQDVQIRLLPRVTPSDTAVNVSIGKCSIIACYPDLAEIVLKPFSGLLKVTVFDCDGEPVTTVTDAAIGQVSEMVFRADVAPGVWVEVDASTGISLIHQHSLSTVFTNCK
ncbi:MAG: hypothetical protein JNM22_02035 [Saprospiraceae bacterium]|nr:hypothetical protein [Saprospiraceae bacterium]